MFKAGYRRTKHRLKPIKTPSGPEKVKVGLPKSEADSKIIEIAIWNHFGTNGGGWGGPIPERPFLANAMKDNKAAYLAALKKSAPKLLRGDTSLSSVMAKLGLLAQGHIRSEITNLRTPPNSEVTIEMKGSSNPLIDSGELRGAVTWKTE